MAITDEGSEQHLCLSDCAEAQAGLCLFSQTAKQVSYALALNVPGDSFYIYKTV